MNLKAGYFERHKMDKLFANLMKGRKVRNIQIKNKKIKIVSRGSYKQITRKKCKISKKWMIFRKI